MSENPNLRDCAACGEKIAKSAQVCPHCGARHYSHIEAESWLLLIALVVLGCGYWVYKNIDWFIWRYG